MVVVGAAVVVVVEGRCVVVVEDAVVVDRSDVDVVVSFSVATFSDGTWVTPMTQNISKTNAAMMPARPKVERSRHSTAARRDPSDVEPSDMSSLPGIGAS